MEIVGLWDLDQLGLSLGGTLIFAEELAALSTLHDGSRRVISFVGKPGYLPASSTGSPVSKRFHEFSSRNSPPLFSALSAISGVDSCNYSRSAAMVVRRLPANHVLWSAGKGGASTASRGSMTCLQRFYRRSGRLPRLKFRSSVVKTVVRWLARRIPDCYPVSVHLKKTSPHRTQSNAYWPAWQSLFRSVSPRRKIVFVLIGDDPVPEVIASLPNVLVARSEGLDLTHELALVGRSHFFMGMASGPCTAAILSDVPYVIYKHPTHHRLAMERELEGARSFAFANRRQRLVRQLETPASLISEFRRMDTPSRRRSWASRIGRGFAES